MAFVLPPRGVEIVLLMLVVSAAVYDVRYRRIPNWLNLAGVIAGLVLNSFIRGSAPGILSWSGLLFGLQGLGLAFVVYFVLYALHAMGAGDVKLMAAVGSLVGWQDWFGIFLITAIVGGLLAVAVSLARGRLKTTFWNVAFILNELRSGRPAYVGKEELDVRSPKSFGLPHGFVIAIGTLLFLAAAARLSQ